MGEDFDLKQLEELEDLIKQRPQTLERLAQERPRVPVALLYTRKGELYLANCYPALGFLVNFSINDPNIILSNGVNYSPYHMPAPNYAKIEIPADQLLTYSVLDIKKKSKRRAT